MKRILLWTVLMLCVLNLGVQGQTDKTFPKGNKCQSASDRAAQFVALHHQCYGDYGSQGERDRVLSGPQTVMNNCEDIQQLHELSEQLSAAFTQKHGGRIRWAGSSGAAIQEKGLDCGQFKEGSQDWAWCHQLNTNNHFTAEIQRLKERLADVQVQTWFGGSANVRIEGNIAPQDKRQGRMECGGFETQKDGSVTITCECLPKGANCPVSGSFSTFFGDTPEPNHRWASELDGKKEADGSEWVWHRFSHIVEKRKLTRLPDFIPSMPMWSGFRSAEYEPLEKYVLDFCILHGETRVIQPEEQK